MLSDSESLNTNTFNLVMSKKVYPKLQITVEFIFVDLVVKIHI